MTMNPHAACAVDAQTTGEVHVQIACTEAMPAADAIRAWAIAALDGGARGDAGDDTGSDTGEVCIRLVGEREGAALNARFRGAAKSTNVLAFEAAQPGLLGDIAICAPVAAAEARSQGKPLGDHVAHLVVHGILHLLGMDHGTDADAEAMEARERAILADCGIGDPYAQRTPAA